MSDTPKCPHGFNPCYVCGGGLPAPTPAEPKCPANHGEPSITPACPDWCGGDGGHLFTCPAHPVNTPALDRLDFEAMRDAIVSGDDTEARKIYNAQVAEIVRAEREKGEREFVEWLRSTNAHKTADKFISRHTQPSEAR